MQSTRFRVISEREYRLASHAIPKVRLGFGPSRFVAHTKC